MEITIYPRLNVTNEAIVTYWLDKIDWDLINVDAESAHERCWGCYDKPTHGSKPLEKCHIVPVALGGQSIPSNMVILCNQCHKENPNTAIPQLYWEWLMSRAKPNIYGWPVNGGLYWTWRGFSEYQSIYGSDPLSDLYAILGDKSPKVFVDDLIQFCMTQSTNDGQRHSPATMANGIRGYIITKYPNNVTSSNC